MRKILAAVLAFAVMASAAPASAADLDAAERSKLVDALDLMAPASIERSGDQLVVVLPQRQVNAAMLKTALTMLCARRDSAGLGDVRFTELALLNQFGRQGFVYESGLGSCDQILAAKGAQLEALILGQSHQL